MESFVLGSRVPPIGRRDIIKAGVGTGAEIALNGRRIFAQSRPNQPVTIDVHTHWEPEPYLKILSQLRPPASSTPPLSADPLMFDLDKRRKWMDERGVQMHVLTLSNMPWEWVPSEVGAQLARIVNDAAIEAHKAFPDRFVAGIEMSIRDPQLAMRELNRVAGNPGLRAVHLPNSIDGQDYLFDPAYEPLLARCQELGYTLLFHPLEGEANYYGGKQRLGDRLSRMANLNNSLGFAFEQATTAAKLIISGALDKFPALEIVLPYAGGVFPYVAGRFHHGLATFNREYKLQRPFKDYMRRFHYDTLAKDREALRFLISFVGSDRVVVGTDNFAITGKETPNALIEQLNLPAEDRSRILSGNAMKLFRLS